MMLHSLLESNVRDKTNMANHTQFKSGNAFQTNKRSWSHHEISARADGGPRFRVCAREILCSAHHQCGRQLMEL